MGLWASWSLITFRVCGVVHQVEHLGRRNAHVYRDQRSAQNHEVYVVVFLPERQRQSDAHPEDTTPPKRQQHGVMPRWWKPGRAGQISGPQSTRLVSSSHLPHALPRAELSEAESVFVNVSKMSRILWLVSTKKSV